jgi:hypothetical protein
MQEALVIIAAVCLIILTGALISLAAIVLRILLDLRAVFKNVKRESEFVVADIHEFRQSLKSGSGTQAKVAGLLLASRAAGSFVRWAAGRSIKRLPSRDL